ncbi:hypothetical protein IF2G_07166 [Cordyceps javanica]|nr:hypothetical protein IF2G_07166 [Cordyceps javanica]
MYVIFLLLRTRLLFSACSLIHWEPYTPYSVDRQTSHARACHVESHWTKKCTSCRRVHLPADGTSPNKRPRFYRYTENPSANTAKDQGRGAKGQGSQSQVVLPSISTEYRPLIDILRGIVSFTPQPTQSLREQRARECE